MSSNSVVSSPLLFNKNPDDLFIVPFLFKQNYFTTEQIIILPTITLLTSLRILKDHVNYQYKILSCISGVDFLTFNYRFGIIYELLSITYNTRLRVKCFLNKVSFIPTVTGLYPNASWWEREAWDMYGFFFEFNASLRRILTDYSFEGYPLRKDYPLSGFFELEYDMFSKKLFSNFLTLTQDYRQFNYEMPW